MRVCISSAQRPGANHGIAHFIKDRSTQRSKAMCSLTAERRWCLSGTPIQNSISDLGGLLKFLKIYPYGDPSEFQNRIIRPMKNGEVSGLQKLRLLLNSIALRRTKGVVQLTPRVDIVEELRLSNEERGLYEISRDESMDLIDNVIRAQDYLKQFCILQAILRQRQICNHGADLLPNRIRARLQRRYQARFSADQPPSGEELSIFCEVCESEIDVMEYKNQAPFDSCLHIVCSRCLYTSSPEAESTNVCPICGDIDGEKKVGNQETVSLRDWFSELEYSGPSTKVMALIDNIKTAQREHTGSEPIKRLAYRIQTTNSQSIETDIPRVLYSPAGRRCYISSKLRSRTTVSSAFVSTAHLI
jgi:SNF2 family DNA or RNA helicase